MPPLDYSELTDEEARQRFESFTATVPERVAALRAEVGEGVLDFSPESLVPLWEWFLRREGGGGDVPAWYVPDPPEVAAERLSPATLRDVDAIGAYVAEIFLRNAEGAEWAIAKLPERMKYVHQNKPVIKLGEQDVDPVGIVYANAVRSVLLGMESAPDALLQTYRANLG